MTVTVEEFQGRAARDIQVGFHCVSSALRAPPAKDVINHFRGKTVVHRLNKVPMHCMIKRGLRFHGFNDWLIRVRRLGDQFLSTLAKIPHSVQIPVQRIVLDRFNFEHEPHLERVVDRLFVDIEDPDAPLRKMRNNTVALKPFDGIPHRAYGHIQKIAEFSLRCQLSRTKQAIIQSDHEFVMGEAPNGRMRGFSLIGFDYFFLPGVPKGGLVAIRNSR